ncbi:MAG: hypothetical protein AAGF11_35260 [Myxococcota bacterium]
MPDYPTREVPARDGTTILLPTLEALEGYSVLGYNFAGPGWNSSRGGMAARPTDTFDFAAKLHDLHYCISDIGFKTKGEHADDVEEGTGNARDRSHQHKADLIFRLMVEHAENWGAGPYYSRTRFIHEQTEYAQANDGFINILSESVLCTVLNEYRMIPWSHVDREDRQYTARRGRNNPPRPIYSAPIPEDAQWYQWAMDFYAPVWGQILAVV